jgi:uncharacterized Zn finger protein (UPF0148 family)
LRRPAVNLGERNKYDSISVEREIDTRDTKAAKRYCPIDNVLLVFNYKDETWLCPVCGIRPFVRKEPVHEEDSSSAFLETATHYRTKTGEPMQTDQDIIMSIEPITSQKSRRYDSAKSRFSHVTDSDSARLRERGYTLIREFEVSQSIGTVSSDELRKMKERRMR